MRGEVVRGALSSSIRIFRGAEAKMCPWVWWRPGGDERPIPAAGGRVLTAIGVLSAAAKPNAAAALKRVGASAIVISGKSSSSAAAIMSAQLAQRLINGIISRATVPRLINRA